MLKKIKHLMKIPETPEFVTRKLIDGDGKRPLIVIIDDWIPPSSASASMAMVASRS